ncbi:dipeptidase [Peribacillus muralis]|uniref:dipeptidase n=1 Tax=Peribacillus muralis TaxID=264697 RepID=UPI00070D1437|nr:dipeptidase [Peribacillus muralis]
MGAGRGITLAIFDAHCDVLMKMFIDPDISFLDSEKLHITKRGLLDEGGKVQCFAIYIPEKVHPDMRFQAALAMVDIFHEKILSEPEMKFIKTKADMESLKETEIGAILTLEGCDCIGNDLLKLKTLLHLGVSSVGLTWNHANLLADGALETRGAGLTDFGAEVVTLLNEKAVWCDVSHLSEAGFWDTIKRADFPIASHSNAYSLCSNPRNLKDSQIKALLQKNGVIGVTFVPQFLSNGYSASIKDILMHIDHICSLGGERQIGLGSDFDGIDHMVENLTAYKDYHVLVNELNRLYSSEFVNGLLFGNFARHFPVKKDSF